MSKWNIKLIKNYKFTVAWRNQTVRTFNEDAILDTVRGLGTKMKEPRQWTIPLLDKLLN